MYIFLDKIVFGLCLAVVIGVWSADSMKLDVHYKIGISVIALGIAYVAGNAIYKHNKSEKDSAAVTTQSQAADSKQVFTARLNSFLQLKFVGPLLCMYNSYLGETIAPVNIAINVEVASLRPGRSRVYTYKASALVEYSDGGKVIKETYPLFNIPISSCVVYMIVNHNWATTQRLDFSSNNFDLNARNTQLQEGESISGWIFFEIDPNVRGRDYKVIQIDLTVENNLKESQTITLTPPDDKGNESRLSSGSLIFTGENHDLTKKRYTLTPMMDLHEMIKQEKGKSQAQ